MILWVGIKIGNGIGIEIGIVTKTYTGTGCSDKNWNRDCQIFFGFTILKYINASDLVCVALSLIGIRPFD